MARECCPADDLLLILMHFVLLLYLCTNYLQHICIVIQAYISCEVNVSRHTEYANIYHIVIPLSLKYTLQLVVILALLIKT